MGRLAAVLAAVAVLLSAVFLGHGLATGIAVPYPDPTPEQRASERDHRAVSGPLFVAAGAAWLAAGVVTAAHVGRRVVRRGRA